MRTPFSNIDTDNDFRSEHSLQRLPLQFASIRIVAMTDEGRQIVLDADDLAVEGDNAIAILRSSRHSAMPLLPTDRLPDPDVFRLLIDCQMKPGPEGRAMTVRLVEEPTAPDSEEE